MFEYNNKQMTTAQVDARLLGIQHNKQQPWLVSCLDSNILGRVILGVIRVISCGCISFEPKISKDYKWSEDQDFILKLREKKDFLRKNGKVALFNKTVNYLNKQQPLWKLREIKVVPKKVAEAHARAAAEQKAAEAHRLAEQQRAIEQRQLAEQKAQEQRRLAEQHKAAELKLVQEQRLAEQALNLATNLPTSIVTSFAPVVNKQEEVARRMADELRRQEEQMRRQAEIAQKLQEAAKQREVEEKRRQQEAAHRDAEEKRRQEEVARRQADESRRQQEAARQREAEEKRRQQEMARQQEADQKRRAEEAARAMVEERKRAEEAARLHAAAQQAEAVRRQHAKAVEDNSLILGAFAQPQKSRETGASERAQLGTRSGAKEEKKRATTPPPRQVEAAPRAPVNRAPSPPEGAHARAALNSRAPILPEVNSVPKQQPAPQTGERAPLGSRAKN